MIQCYIILFSLISDKTRNSLMQCATGIIGKIQADCKPQETIMVGTTLQNMMGAYEGVCKFELIVASFFFFRAYNLCIFKALEEKTTQF
jgi:hypothetical protein